MNWKTVNATEQQYFRDRFQRSGSLGIPFIPDEESANLKEYWGQSETEDGQGSVTLVIGLHKHSDGIVKAIKLIQESDVIIDHIESRKTHQKTDYETELLVQLILPRNINDEVFDEKHHETGIDLQSSLSIITNKLKLGGLQVAKIATNVRRNMQNTEKTVTPARNSVMGGYRANRHDIVVWFPRTIFELDITAKRVLMYGAELDADHPGFKDEVYRKRRMLFAEIALNYKHGEPIPRVEYSDSENKTWRIIFRELRELHLKHACKEYLDNFALLQQFCGYSERKIPQLDDISRFLKGKTGFQIRPVAGYLSSRDFLAGLAFRVFHCTQYIRHPVDPFYSPEPDCCHELLGHMPMFADADFAQFSQDIGLASLGASDVDILKLATLYFFSIEFGLCKEFGQLKVYGAGLLSSIAELKHAVSEGNKKIMPFEPERVIQQNCLITSFQDAYFVSENFEEAQQKLRVFTSNMKRPFVVRYNAYTESIDLLNNKRSLTLTVNSLRSDINLLTAALHTML